MKNIFLKIVSGVSGYFRTTVSEKEVFVSKVLFAILVPFITLWYVLYIGINYECHINSFIVNLVCDYEYRLITSILILLSVVPFLLVYFVKDIVYKIMCVCLVLPNLTYWISDFVLFLNKPPGFDLLISMLCIIAIICFTNTYLLTLFFRKI